MTLIWLIAFLGLLLIEFLTVNLVSVWFALGALSAMICSMFTESLTIQTITFIGVSLVSLVLTKPIMKKLKIFNIEPTNFDRVIGQKGEVIKSITALDYGEVKVLGNVWTATSTEELVVGTKVVVEKIEGVKLIVRKDVE